MRNATQPALALLLDAGYAGAQTTEDGDVRRDPSCFRKSQGAGPAAAVVGAGRLSPTADRLREKTRSAAEGVVAKARSAHRLGRTAESHRASGLDLDRQADRAERLLFGQAVETFRTTAAEHRLIADALDAIETGDGPCRSR